MAALSAVQSRVKAVLVDLSGTIHVGDSAIVGAAEALKRLESSGLQVRYVTNTTKMSRKSLVGEVLAIELDSERTAFSGHPETLFGFDFIKEEMVYSSPFAARRILETRKLRPMYLIDKDLEEDFKGISTENPNAVVIGLAQQEFHYEKLNQAFRLLLSGGQLIAIHKARYYAEKDGLYLGPGAFVAGLEFATDKEAIVAGKPEPAFFQTALNDLNCAPKSAVMIGDDLKQDVEGALLMGMKGILVRTGKFRPVDETNKDIKPTYICDSIVEAAAWILKYNESVPARPPPPPAPSVPVVKPITKK